MSYIKLSKVRFSLNIRQDKEHCVSRNTFKEFN